MDANVKLSANEMALVTDAGFILTKQAIIEKVFTLFGRLSDDFRAIVAASPGVFPAAITAIAPKIYKGEQYRQLPYVMLDYPRYFTGGHVCAIRCFFWWGHSFSIHLHLSGKWKQNREPAIAAMLQSGALNNWYYCLSADEWQHHFDESNYRLAGTAMAACMQHVYAQHFIKLAQKIPLQEWDHAYSFYVNAFGSLVQLLQQWAEPPQR